MAGNTFTGGSGNDTYTGGNENDTITGNAGDDTLYGAGGDDTMTGDAGNDSLFGGSGDDTIDGGSGADVIDGGSNADSITGGSGDDKVNLTASFGNDTIAGGETSETAGDWLDASGMDKSVTLIFTGSEAGSVTDGTSTATFSQIENFRLSGFNDSLNGASNTASMVVDGGAGNDTITGGSGNDTVFGGSGNDSLTGGGGDDTFRLATGFGTDTMMGGETGETGGDTLDASDLNRTVTVTYTGSEAGTISDGVSTGTFSQIENMTLTSGADSVNGAASTTGIKLDAGGASDTVTGGSGADTLYGGSGADSVSGNDGDDALYGGGGSPIGTTYIQNGDFSAISQGWSGTDIETTYTENAYLGNGSTNNVAETDGNSGQTTVMQQSFTVDGAETATLNFRSVVRTNGGVGTDGFKVEVLDANGTVVSTTTVLPPSNSAWTNYSINVAFPASGTYTLRFTEVGNNDSLGAIIDDVQLTSTSVSTDTASDTLSGGNGNDTLDGGGGGDSLLGGAGSDSLVGGDGADSLYGGTEADALSGDAGADLIYGGANDDSLFGGTEADTLYGDAGNDYVSGDAGTDSLFGGGGADSLYGGAGADSISGDAGKDLIYGGDAADSLSGGTEADTVYGDAGTDLIYGGDAADNLFGGTEADTVYGDAGTDLIYGGDAADSLFGGTEADTLYGDAGNDTAWGGAGADNLYGGDGSDSLIGGAAADTLDGGDGNDVLDGGDGVDSFYAGAGDDTIFGGAGAEWIEGAAGSDVIDGGADQDTILGGIGDTVSGGEGGTDQDVLDLTAYGWALTDIIYDPANPESGVVTFYDASGQVIGTESFTNIEKVLVCFTPGTMITTDRGEVAVEHLGNGDRVFTRDNGYQTLRWVGAKTLSVADLVVNPGLRPIRISKGALGDGLPERDMRVSPQHRMLFVGPRAEMLFGEGEVLVAATHLTHLPGVDQVMARGITYMHLLFDGHEIIRADGAWTESFQPAERTLNALDDAARGEIEDLFPGISAKAKGFLSARPTLKAHEVKVLLRG